jgi:hypothetical protein
MDPTQSIFISDDDQDLQINDDIFDGSNSQAEEVCFNYFLTGYQLVTN